MCRDTYRYVHSHHPVRHHDSPRLHATEISEVACPFKLPTRACMSKIHIETSMGGASHQSRLSFVLPFPDTLRKPRDYIPPNLDIGESRRPWIMEFSRNEPLRGSPSTRRSAQPKACFALEPLGRPLSSPAGHSQRLLNCAKPR